MKLIIGMLFIIVVVTGCDYVPYSTYEIKTVDGEIIKIRCSIVDPNRSKYTYIIEGDCQLYR